MISQVGISGMDKVLKIYYFSIKIQNTEYRI